MNLNKRTKGPETKLKLSKIVAMARDYNLVDEYGDHKYTIKQLAKKYKISERSAYRYFNKLKSLDNNLYESSA